MARWPRDVKSALLLCIVSRPPSYDTDLGLSRNQFTRPQVVRYPYRIVPMYVPLFFAGILLAVSDQLNRQDPAF